MVVHDRHDIRPRFVERAVDEPLEVRRAAARIDRRAIERELHDVIRLDAIGCTRAREKIALRIVRIAHADVSEGIDHALAREDAVCRDKFFDQVIQPGHSVILVHYRWTAERA